MTNILFLHAPSINKLMSNLIRNLSIYYKIDRLYLKSFISSKYGSIDWPFRWYITKSFVPQIFRGDGNAVFFFEVKIGGVEFISRNIHFQNEINPFLIFYNFFSIMKSISFSSVHPVWDTNRDIIKNFHYPDEDHMSKLE